MTHTLHQSIGLPKVSVPRKIGTCLLVVFLGFSGPEFGEITVFWFFWFDRGSLFALEWSWTPPMV